MSIEAIKVCCFIISVVCLLGGGELIKLYCKNTQAITLRFSRDSTSINIRRERIDRRHDVILDISRRDMYFISNRSFARSCSFQSWSSSAVTASLCLGESIAVLDPSGRLRVHCKLLWTKSAYSKSVLMRNDR